MPVSRNKATEERLLVQQLGKREDTKSGVGRIFSRLAENRVGVVVVVESDTREDIEQVASREFPQSQLEFVALIAIGVTVQIAQ